MLVNDRRDEKWLGENPRHCLVVATDKFMSGWGGAEGGSSVAAWACAADELAGCLAAIESRPGMFRVRVVGGSYQPRNAAHFSDIWDGNGKPTGDPSG